METGPDKHRAVAVVPVRIAIAPTQVAADRLARIATRNAKAVFPERLAAAIAIKIAVVIAGKIGIVPAQEGHRAPAQAAHHAPAQAAHHVPAQAAHHAPARGEIAPSEAAIVTRENAATHRARYRNRA